MKIKIESKIPIPLRLKYPFKEMKVGDSFAVEFDKLSSVRSACSYFAIHNKGYKFITRAEGKQIRVWRAPLNGEAT